MGNIWRELDRPIKVLAPMAGYTDASFRLLCRLHGADLVMSELVSADAIAYASLSVEKLKFEIEKKTYNFNLVVAKKNQSTANLLSFFEEERPFVVQLFGKYPEKFGLAAKWISGNLKPDGIDINMGCPARKVVGSDHGAALLKNPKLACEIVRAVKENTSLPVSVKTRLGWDSDDQVFDFVPKLIDAGIDAITIHGRTYRDAFKGKARWENIFEIKKIVGDKLVVIGNGDICTRLDESFLDGFAVGRAMFGKPWLFSSEKISKEQLRNIIMFHADLVSNTKGERGMFEFRKHLLTYLREFPGAKELRKEAVTVSSDKDVASIVNKLQKEE